MKKILTTILTAVLFLSYQVVAFADGGVDPYDHDLEDTAIAGNPIFVIALIAFIAGFIILYTSQTLKAKLAQA